VVRNAARIAMTATTAEMTVAMADELSQSQKV
jgi:hypothetical protein